MFSTDFKKHLEILKQLNDALIDQPQNVREVVDIIGKWSCIKLAESQNTTFAASLFDFYSALFESFISAEQQLIDHEAYVVIPLLCDKAGLNNAILKDKVKKLIRTVFSIYDHKKTIALLFKFGIASKNLKAVAENLDELTIFISFRGLDKITEKDLQAIAKYVDSSDKAVRENSLACIAEIYKILDEKIWQVLGPLNLKVKGLLEGRFKQIKKGNDPMNVSMSGANKSLNSQRGSIKPAD